MKSGRRVTVSMANITCQYPLSEINSISHIECGGRKFQEEPRIWKMAVKMEVMVD